MNRVILICLSILFIIGVGVQAVDAKKKQSVWAIQINTIEELLAFIMKYGEVIISPSTYKEIPFSIEIYDTYRE